MLLCRNALLAHTGDHPWPLRLQFALRASALRNLTQRFLQILQFNAFKHASRTCLSTKSKQQLQLPCVDTEGNATRIRFFKIACPSLSECVGRVETHCSYTLVPVLNKMRTSVLLGELMQKHFFVDNEGLLSQNTTLVQLFRNGDALAQDV